MNAEKHDFKNLRMAQPVELQSLGISGHQVQDVKAVLELAKA